MRFARKHNQARALSGSARSGFTLIELLATIAVIAILASLLLSAVSKSKGKARQIACLNNLKQLGVAFMLYHAENGDAFPACGSRDTYGAQAEDWIWWQSARPVERSAIAPYLGRFMPKLFRCAEDREALKPATPQQQQNEPYLYSYTLTSYDLEKGANLGMGSIIKSNAAPERLTYLFKAPMIRNPSQKIMLAEEDRSSINDGRWIPNRPSFNLLTRRHNNKGNVCFADGSAQAAKRDFGTNAAHSLPLFEP